MREQAATQPAADAASAKKFLSVREAAALLDVSKQTIYKLSCLGVLPKYKLPHGEKMYFAREDLEAYVSSGFIPATFATDADVSAMEHPDANPVKQ